MAGSGSTTDRPAAAAGLTGTISSGNASTAPPVSQGQQSPGPRRSRAEMELEEIMNASPGSQRRHLARMQAELAAAKRKAMSVDDRNKDRGRRRRAGEADVSEDEEEELEVAFKKAILMQAGSVNRAVQQGASFAQVAGVKKSNDILITEAELVEVDPYTDAPPTPSVVLDLIREKVYAPLRIFTTTSLVGISRGDLVKIVTVPVRGEKKQLMDVTLFNEKNMTPTQFYNAWTNLLRILEPRTDEVVFKSLATTYYARLTGHEDFESNFASYFNFDMDFRLKWFTAPHKITDHVFSRLPRFLSSKESREREVQQAVQEAMTKFMDSSRWAPYPSPGASSSSAAQPARTPSFRASFGSGSGSGSGSFSGMCLVCGGSGHKAAHCVAKTAASGAVLFAKWDGSKLVRNVDGAYICAAHNTRGCPRFNHDGHVCSLCGSAAHAAHNATCGGRA